VPVTLKIRTGWEPGIAQRATDRRHCRAGRHPGTYRSRTYSCLWVSWPSRIRHHPHHQNPSIYPGHRQR
jgi:hypothetical protein